MIAYMEDLNLFQVSHLARSIVKEAGDQLRFEWKTTKENTYKDARDLATQYDTLIEQRISSALSSLFPDHAIHGEEITHISRESDYAWYIDPIDGTKYFAADIPLFSVSLGLTKAKQPVLGVIYNPVSNQMYSGFQGGSAHLNYEDIAVASQRPLSETVIYADMSKFERESLAQQRWIQEKYFEMAAHTYRIRSFGCGSLALSWIASGGFDGFVDFTGKTKLFDVCAGLAVLEAAGGVYEYVNKGETKHLIASGNQKTLDSLKTILLS